MRLFKRENDLRAALVLRFFGKEFDNFSGALILHEIDYLRAVLDLHFFGNVRAIICYRCLFEM